MSQLSRATCRSQRERSRNAKHSSSQARPDPARVATVAFAGCCAARLGWALGSARKPAATIRRMTAKEKLRERVEDLAEQEAEATLEFITSQLR